MSEQYNPLHDIKPGFLSEGIALLDVGGRGIAVMSGHDSFERSYEPETMTLTAAKSSNLGELNLGTSAYVVRYSQLEISPDKPLPVEIVSVTEFMNDTTHTITQLLQYNEDGRLASVNKTIDFNGTVTQSFVSIHYLEDAVVAFDLKYPIEPEAPYKLQVRLYEKKDKDLTVYPTADRGEIIVFRTRVSRAEAIDLGDNPVDKKAMIVSVGDKTIGLDLRQSPLIYLITVEEAESILGKED